MHIMPWEVTPEAIRVTLREKRATADGQTVETRVDVCSICLGNGVIYTADVGQRACLCQRRSEWWARGLLFGYVER